MDARERIRLSLNNSDEGLAGLTPASHSSAQPLFLGAAITPPTLPERSEGTSEALAVRRTNGGVADDSPGEAPRTNHSGKSRQAVSDGFGGYATERRRQRRRKRLGVGFVEMILAGSQMGWVYYS